MARRFFSLCAFRVGPGGFWSKIGAQNRPLAGSGHENGPDPTDFQPVSERSRHTALAYSVPPSAGKAFAVLTVIACSKSDYLASLIVSPALSSGINTFRWPSDQIGECLRRSLHGSPHGWQPSTFQIVQYFGERHSVKSSGMAHSAYCQIHTALSDFRHYIAANGI